MTSRAVASKATIRERSGIVEKRCSWCFNWFPATAEYFHRKGATGRHGLHCWCKPCACAYHRPRNKERYMERKAQAVEVAA